MTWSRDIDSLVADGNQRERAEDATQIRCFTCGSTDTELDGSWGPFCVGTDCRAIADREADQAADNRYI